MIENIIKAYKESFHGNGSCERFPGLLFKRDKNSEQLYEKLQDPDLTRTVKAKAIKE